MLGGQLEQDFADLLEGHASTESNERLASSAILTNEPQPPSPPVPSLPVTTSSLYESVRGAAPARLIVETILLQHLARRALVRRSFGDITSDLGHMPQRPGEKPHSSPETLVAALVGAERVAQRADDCLAIGIAMSRMLARRNLTHCFVIGVTLPFAAHCWVQAGAVVLTDSVERVARFTPILVL